MPQQKIKFFGGLQPTGVDTSTSDTLRAIAGFTSKIGDIAFAEGAKKRQKEGMLAGAQSVKRNEKGDVIAPTLETDSTIFGESFNQSAIMAHKTQVSMDVKEDLDRLQNQHKLDPKAFRSAADGVKKGLLQSMPEELAIIIGNDFDASVSSRNSKLLKDMFRRESEQHRATALAGVESMQDDITNAARNGEDVTTMLINANAELDSWVQTGKISAIEAESFRENTAERIQEQTALGEIDSVIFNEDLTVDEQIKKGIDFVDELRERKLKDLSAEQKDSLLNVVSSKIRGLVSKRNAMDNARDIAKEKIVSNLKVETNLIEERAKNGEIVDLSGITERIEGLHNQGDISGNERTSLLTHKEKAQDEIDRISLANKRIIARLNGDNSIEMNNKDIDFYYKTYVQDDLESFPPEAQNLANANFILLTRSIPKQVKSKITSQVLSGDPDQIKQASDLIDRIDNISGLANLAVDANQRAFINKVVELSDSMEPEQAVTLAKELTDPRDKARIDANKQKIKTEKMESNYEDVVENAFEGFFGGDYLVDNINSESVNAEYKELFESFFIAGDSKEVSENKAIEILQANWKDSDFGFMKHRPEDFYSIGGDTGYIKEQLLSDVRKGIGTDFKKEDLFLLSDDETARMASQGRPTYRVMALDSNGEIKSFPGRWSPDIKAQSKKIKAKNIKHVEDERSAGKKAKKSALKSLERLKL